jgi:hypothetical protein
MDIPSLSMNLAQTKLMSNIGTAMLAKSIEQADTVGTGVTELIDSAEMERSVYPEIGGNIDISV